MQNPPKDETLTLELLEAIEESSEVTQRHLARRMGVALGLANAYLKRCARKGLIKVQQAPANRYLYYLTPMGFAEKSRLTAEYLRYSLSFYRRASDSLRALLAECRNAGQRRLVLAGASDLAEIASLHAGEFGLYVVAVQDDAAEHQRWADRPVLRQLPADEHWDVCIVTDLRSPQETWGRLVAATGGERVRAPSILAIDTRPEAVTGSSTSKN